ncbi:MULTISPECIES: DUF5085 family protein [Clostridia]|uniref:DUF5085 family protein n=1 Tax=Clostridia TaxID=186801 RepID=UPI000EA2A44B|nr:MULTISPECIES: DUF5085 family protein [Clostridia]NBJ70446.1 DUF5085 family protein [Roseburia sp. 1XD42-34]RKI76270.1 DUF5085 family protein [Clostridium sp. 1xD42-85]
MIVEHHHIAHTNVVSKYYQFVPEEMELAIKDFQSILEKGGYHPDGRMLFTILSEPTSEIMQAEIFLPIVENNFTKLDEEQQANFHSYFSVKPMIMTRIMDDFEAASQVKFWELMNYIRRNGLEQKTPVFVEYKTSHMGRRYVEMSVGV